MPDRAALDALLQRHSTPSRQLGLPAPDAACLEQMLQAAIRVPDHGKLVPFRLLLIDGDARLALGEFLAARSAQRNPGMEALIDKDRQRFAHAPLVVTVIARPQAHPKVPEWEQLLTAGCVCMNLLHAAQALGFGAQWLTAWMAEDRAVAGHLGLAADERIVGFIHIGTPKLAVPERERPSLDSLLTHWTPPTR
jgi:nitroreductase